MSERIGGEPVYPALSTAMRDQYPDGMPEAKLWFRSDRIDAVWHDGGKTFVRFQATDKPMEFADPNGTSYASIVDILNKNTRMIR